MCVCVCVCFFFNNSITYMSIFMLHDRASRGDFARVQALGHAART